MNHDDPAAQTQLPTRLSPIAAARVRQRLAEAPVPWLHEEVGRRMADRLAVIKRTPAEVLDWWGDIGGAGAALRAAYPKARIATVPAAAAEAQALAKRRWPWQRVPRRIAAAAVPEGAADLVWSNMALHFEPDRAALPVAWLKSLKVDGFLMFSTFGPGTLPELRALYAANGWGPPHAPFEDMHDIGDRLVGAGFADPVMDQERLTLTYADAAALLAELRALGANMDATRHRGLRTPRWRERWLAAVGALAGADGRIAVTFEIAYGHAFKPPPRATVTPRTVVELDRMREMLKRRDPR